MAVIVSNTQPLKQKYVVLGVWVRWANGTTHGTCFDVFLRKGRRRHGTALMTIHLADWWPGNFDAGIWQSERETKKCLQWIPVHHMHLHLQNDPKVAWITYQRPDKRFMKSRNQIGVSRNLLSGKVKVADNIFYHTFVSLWPISTERIASTSNCLNMLDERPILMTASIIAIASISINAGRNRYLWANRTEMRCEHRNNERGRFSFVRLSGRMTSYLLVL